MSLPISKKNRNQRVLEKAKRLRLDLEQFGGLGNVEQKPCKKILLDFINTLYMKRFERGPKTVAML